MVDTKVHKWSAWHATGCPKQALKTQPLLLPLAPTAAKSWHSCLWPPSRQCCSANLPKRAPSELQDCRVQECHSVLKPSASLGSPLPTKGLTARPAVTDGHAGASV